MSAEWDDDISQLNLSEFEKNGLQIYRNYNQAFTRHREKLFAEKVNQIAYDPSALKSVLETVTKEDQRILPIVACAYADDLLLAMFKEHISKDVPGGLSAIFGSYGPLSSFSSRIKLAYMFRLMSLDLIQDLDKLRKVRNQIAHGWSMSSLENFYQREPIIGLHPIEAMLTERDELAALLVQSDPLITFRVRLLWLLARITYEARLFAHAKRERLEPHSALYGTHKPDLLGVVSKLALSATRGLAQ